MGKKFILTEVEDSGKKEPGKLQTCLGGVFLILIIIAVIKCCG